jgi:glutathione S-transferase
MLTVWGRRSSSNVQALMWTIDELGLAYERHDAGFRYGVVDTPAFLAMNPNGKVPVIRDGDQPPMFETGAILRYLAARYGDGGAFWPADPASRAAVDQWAEWAKINVTFAFTVPIFWQFVRTRPEDRDAALFARGFKELNRCLDIVEPRLAVHDYLAGGAFTLADIQFGHLLYRYYDLPLDRTERPALAAYYERLRSRPAFRDHVMVSYDELRVQG